MFKWLTDWWYKDEITIGNIRYKLDGAGGCIATSNGVSYRTKIPKELREKLGIYDKEKDEETARLRIE